MNGVEFGAKGGVRKNEDRTSDDVLFTSPTQRTDHIRFEQHMSQLIMISSGYKFSVDEAEFKYGTYGCDTIHISGCTCTGCGYLVDQLSNDDKTFTRRGGARVEK